jgi:hypothetical protein
MKPALIGDGLASDVATDRNSIGRSPVNVAYWLSVR